jgi:ubiquitin-conjugating enzyme (huntingtin interacting protein 2)
MLMNDPDKFERIAREWAIKYAAAPSNTTWDSQPHAASAPSKPKSQQTLSREEEMRKYHGYNEELIDRFVNMGFDLDRVVEAFEFVHIDKNNGEDYELEEAYMGDITARLLGEP